MNHSIRTADNLSPLQLWMEGMLHTNEDISSIDEVRLFFFVNIIKTSCTAE